MEIKLVSLEIWADYEHEILKQEGLTPIQIAEIERNDQVLEHSQDNRILSAIQARQLVVEFHNRHIGLPCGLAYRLARVLQRPMLKGEAAQPWNDVLERLAQEIAPKDPLLTGASQVIRPAAGVLLNEAPIYVIYRLVMPLVQMACQALGKCFLATPGATTHPISKVSDLLQYDKKMTSKIADLTKTSANPDLDLFWTDRAFALASYSGRPTLRQSLPNPNALSAALLYRLDALPETLREYETLQRVPIRFRQQRARRLREDGLSGIVLSRSFEDVDRILLSELLYPPLLRADRLLNTGYLVTERRPRQEKLRDVLVVGFLPPQTGELTSRAFVKTCWFNTMMILAQVLFRHRLFESEFWWVEGDALERYSTAVFPLNHLKTALKTRNQIQVLGHPQFRSMFLNLTRWQPDFIDPDKPWLGGPASQDASQPTGIDGRWDTSLSGTTNMPARWILSTAHTQRLVSPPGEKGLQPTQATSSPPNSSLIEIASGYSMVHFMAFLPVEMVTQDEDDPWGQEIQARLKFGLRLISSSLHNLSITWLAAAGQSRRSQYPPVHGYLGRFFRQKYDWDAAIPVGDLRTLASKLEKTWLDEMVRELQSDI